MLSASKLISPKTSRFSLKIPRLLYRKEKEYLDGKESPFPKESIKKDPPKNGKILFYPLKMN